MNIHFGPGQNFSVFLYSRHSFKLWTFCNTCSKIHCTVVPVPSEKSCILSYPTFLFYVLWIEDKGSLPPVWSWWLTNVVYIFAIIITKYIFSYGRRYIFLKTKIYTWIRVFFIIIVCFWHGFVAHWLKTSKLNFLDWRLRSWKNVKLLIECLFCSKYKIRSPPQLREFILQWGNPGRDTSTSKIILIVTIVRTKHWEVTRIECEWKGEVSHLLSLVKLTLEWWQE